MAILTKRGKYSIRSKTTGFHGNRIIKQEVVNGSGHKSEATLTQRSQNETKVTEESGSRSPLCDVTFWLLPVTGMFVMILNACNSSVFGLLFLELEEIFQVSKFSLGWLNSVYSATEFCVGLIFPWTANKFNYRSISLFAVFMLVAGYVSCAFTPNFYLLYGFYGFIAAIGLNYLHLMQSSIIQNNVKTHLALATSILTTSFGIADLIWPILYKILLNVYTWRGAFLFMAGFGANALVLIFVQTAHISKLGFVFKETNQSQICKEIIKKENKTHDTDDIEKSDASDTIDPVKQPPYCRIGLTKWEITLIIAYFLHMATDTFSITMIALRLDYLQFTQEQIIMVMSTTGAMGIIRFIPCYFIDNFSLSRIKVAGTLSLITGCVATVSIVFTTFYPVLSFFIFWGITQGVVFTLYESVFVDVFGKDKVHRAMGCRSMSSAAASFITLPLSGLILDALQDINIPILLFGGFQVVSAILILGIALCRKPPKEVESPEERRTHENAMEIFTIT